MWMVVVDAGDDQGARSHRYASVVSTECDVQSSMV